ncbi:MAG: F0F1 ATP synthase subunit epsilon [Alphaproteobacteria bacterium]
MATFTFDLVSPERQLFSGPVEQVVVPGTDGDFGVLAGHAPFVAAIRPGILTVHGSGQPQRLFVRGGFAEVSGSGLSVLAETAVPVEQLDVAMIDKEVTKAEEALADATSQDAKTKAAEVVDQLKAVKLALGTLKSTH